jgi:hypothetical protein
MIEGLWTVKFISSLNLWGGGVIVLTKEGRILGGDAGYYYIGTCAVTGNQIKGNVDIIQFDPQIISVFGEISNYRLTFDGTFEDNKFSAIAQSPEFPGHNLRIEGNKKADLIE